MPITPEIIQLGSTAVVSILALWFFFQLLKSRKNNGSDVKKQLEKIERNHFGTLNTKINGLITQGHQSEEKLEKIINILIEIREKIGRS